MNPNPTATEVAQPRLTSADRARLMLNQPETANRWVEFAGKQVAILHLGIGALERFRAACGPIENLYLRYVEVDLPIEEFARLFLDECLVVFSGPVAEAAALALRLPVDVIRKASTPVEALTAVLAQWLHNLEIGDLQKAFPHPEPEDSDEDDPNAGNPMTIVERLMSAYHSSFEEVIERTIPQVYLMGVSSAWSYEKVKRDSEAGSNGSPNRPRKAAKPQPIAVDGKKFSKFKEMNSHQYRAYLEQVFGQMPAVGDVIEG